MNKNLLFSLIFALTASAAFLSLPAFAEGGTMKGTGVEDDPYQIEDYADLKAFAAKVNDGEKRAWAVLTKDIAASDKDWIPIGDNRYYEFTYSGTFDGLGHTIKGLDSGTYSNNDSGLIGFLYKGTVQNVTVHGAVRGDRNTGGIVGFNSGSVKNCSFYGSVEGSVEVGGIVGFNLGKVQNCYNAGSVSGATDVGGVAGDNRGTIINCHNSGSVTADLLRAPIGGIVGSNGSIGYENSTVRYCYNTGSVSAKESTQYIGGVA